MENDSKFWPIFIAAGTIAASVAIVAAIATGTCVDTQFGRINCSIPSEDSNSDGELSGSTVVAEELEPSRETSEITNDLSTVPSAIQHFETVAVGSGSDELREDEAIALVKAWLEAKSEIYGPSHNLELAKTHTINQKLKDVELQIQGLKPNSYWTYDGYKIGEIWAFGYFPDQGTAEILLEITETLNLFENEIRNGKRSGTFKNSYRFYFGRDSAGVWKIANTKVER